MNLAATDIKSEKPGGNIDCNISNVNSCLFLIVVSTACARIDRAYSNYNSMKYPTILFNFNVSCLCHHSFYFKMPISYSSILYVLHPHPCWSHWPSWSHLRVWYFDMFVN